MLWIIYVRKIRVNIYLNLNFLDALIKASLNKQYFILITRVIDYLGNKKTSCDISVTEADLNG